MDLIAIWLLTFGILGCIGIILFTAVFLMSIHSRRKLVDRMAEKLAAMWMETHRIGGGTVASDQVIVKRTPERKRDGMRSR